MALLLSIARKIPESRTAVRNGDFSRRGLMGFDLKDKTIGIVGLGNIGKYTATMANGFGMKILAFDVAKDYAFAKRFGIRFVSLAALLSSSDVICLHAPYNKHTHHLINSQNIRHAKKGAVLINTARGGLVETQAVVTALQTGRLSAAGLDVLEEEELLGKTRLRKTLSPAARTLLRLNTHVVQHPRVIVTPHNAFNTQEALQRILDTTVQNILAWAKGRPRNVVRERV